MIHPRIDQDGDGAISQGEADRYAASLGPGYLEGLELYSNGSRLNMDLLSSAASVSKGAGDLAILAIAVVPLHFEDGFDANFYSSYDDVSGSGMHYQQGVVHVYADSYGTLIMHDGDTIENVLRLIRNPAFLTATLGMAMMTFAQGGLLVWMPTFLSRMRGYSLFQANKLFGVIIAIDGTIASLVGGWLGTAF